MPRSHKLSRLFHRNPGPTSKTKPSTSTRKIAPLTVACVAVLAAIAFSVSVESRSSGWLWRSSSPPPGGVSKSETAKNTKHSTSLNANHSAAPVPVPFASPTVTATKTDSLLTDVDNDGKADPGDTLKYTVGITATGGDATGVTFTDTVDPNTSFVMGSVRTTPLARPDSYTATGNVRIQVPAPGVLANDSDPDLVGPAISVAAGTSTSAQGGNVTMNADGSFAYNPPAGFEGPDTFTYTLNDNDTPNQTDTGTVTVTVSGMIWFINNNVGSSGDGRLTSPFKTLSDFQTVNNGTGNHPAANDNIFVYESATDYVGPVTLLNGQKFIGQDATDTLANIANITLAPNSDALPTTNPGAPIVNITSGGNGINVAQNNILRGFTGGNAAIDINGSSFGTLTVSDVTLNGDGQTLNLTTGTLNGTFGSLSSNNSATTGLSLTGVGGSLSTGSTTVSNSTGIGISVDTSSLTLGFANTSVSGSGGTGVSLTTNTGAITFADLDISPDANQRALLATNNTNTITATSGTISNSGATAVEITRSSSTTPLNLTFTGISSSGGTANGITLSNTSGSFTVVGDGANTSVGGNNSGGTISGKSGADGSTTNGSAVFLNNATNVTLRRMTINGTNQNYGVRGTTVNGFTFEFGTIAGTNGTTNAGGSEEGSIRFDGLVGSASIGSSNIGGGATFNVFVLNTSGTLDRLTMNNNAFGLISASIGNDNVDVTAGTSATVKVTANSNTFAGTRGDFFEAIANNNATLDVIARQNKFSDGQAIIPGGGTAISIRSGSAGLSSTATTTFDVSCNRMNGNDANAYDTVGMFFAKGQDLGTMTGTVVNNTIGPAKTNANADGIFVRSAGAGSVNILVQNNTLSGYGNAGLHFQNNDGSSTMNASVFGNVLSSPNVNNFAGLFMDNGATATDTSTMNAVVGSATDATKQNTLQGAGTVIDVSLSNFSASNATHFNLSKNGSASVTAANVIADDNVGTPSVDTSGGSGPITLVTTLPTVPATPATCSTPAGPVTSSLLSADSISSAPSQDVVKGDSVLYAAKGENKDSQLPVNKLSPAEASAMFQAAISRWAEAGLSARSLAKLQSLTVEVGDLPDGQLATANSSKIVLDETAAGYGWFFDTTPSDDNEFQVPVPDKELQTTDSSAANNRIDLLTVLMRQLSSQVSRGKSASLVGPAAWLMENTLGTGTRRAPSFKKTDEAKPQAAPGVAKLAKPVRSASDAQQRDLNQSVAMNTRRNSRVLRSHAMHVPMTFADVMLNIDTLPAGKTITITFNVTVKDPFPGPGATVCNQGSVTGTNFTTVLTDDPDVVGTSDPTCTPIDLQADLAVTKTDSPDPVIAGTNLTYTIDFVNNGPNASGATVTDATPAGTTFVSASVITGTGWGAPTTPAVGGTGNVVFSNASVASGGTAQFQIVVKVGSNVAPATIITNNATAATTGATDPVPGNNTGTATTTVIAQADLSITKTDGVTEKVPGTGVTYTIVVTNNGPSDANGVSVADTFPSDLTGVTFTSSPTGGATGNTAAGSGPISDTLNMPTGSSVTYTVNATVKSSATGSLSNTATVTAPGNVTDNDTSNNSATDTDTLTPQADLSITKTDGVTSKVPGTSVTYTIVVSNSGPSDAPGSTVADTFSSDLTGVTFTSIAAGGATGNTASGSSNISDTLSLPSGGSVTYTVNATVKSSATGSLVNTATVTAGAGVTDNNNANNSATDTDTLTPQADLSITKTDGSATATPGTPVTYTIVVTNSGPSDAPGTSVVDNFPGILTGVSYTSVGAGGATGNTAGPASGSINDTVSLPSGASVTYTVNATVQASATGSLSNTATVTAGAGVTDPTPGNNSATDTDTLTASADVSVTKADSPDPVVVNNNITYTITVTNNGPSDAQSLSLSDAVPANTTLVSATTPSGWTRTDAVPNGGTGTLTYTRATLPASASSIFTVIVNVNNGTADGTTITNTANVSSTTTDPTPGNNSATATTLVQSNADLAISKLRSPSGTINAGDNVTYTIQFINNGPAPASNVTVSDTLPPGVTAVSQSNPAGWTCNTIPVGGTGTITCTKATMTNGESATLTVVVAVSCSVADGATINNTATIGSGAGSPPDNNTANNSSTVGFTVSNPAVTVVASAAISQLPQNTHELINVGLAALVGGGTPNCPPGPVMVQVFGNEDDQTPTAKNEVFSPDAKDIALSTLRLRAERVNTGSGRVYLIVVRSGSSFSTVTVTVPKSSSSKDMAAVAAAAAAAKSFADANGGAAPAGYFVIGDGPVIGPKQ